MNKDAKAARAAMQAVTDALAGDHARTREEAIAQARVIIENVRVNGFKDRAERFTDGQIWQAVMDARSVHHDAVAVQLIEHVIEGRAVPSADYMTDALGAS